LLVAEKESSGASVLFGVITGLDPVIPLRKALRP